MRLLLKITAVLALILIACGASINLQKHEELKVMRTSQAKITEKLIQETMKEPAENEEPAVPENPDFKGMLVFESGLIELPVVQGYNNEFYLTHLYDGSEGMIGTLFFDMQCEEEDEVRIIYGHSVFDEPSLMFTPLHMLVSQETFEENRFFDLKTPEKTEHYEIFAVLINDQESESALSTRIRGFYDETERVQYLSEVGRRSLIQSLCSVDDNEKLLILSTCLDEEGSGRLCVFAALKGMNQ